ncbi:MAG: EAL domain-containing protein [Pseudanabaenaceae cyanobacterium bins.39]|nr:EAL domain-containing protein [Pseudanabaenaceae cyanobacterium bins.39]
MNNLTSDIEDANSFDDKRSLHILVVEDVAADAELNMLALETTSLSITYDIAANAEEFQKYLQSNTYDAVLSDYRLPDFNGLVAFEYLKESGQDIPFILVTGSLGEEAAVECIKLGMTDYVLKDRLFRLPLVLQRALKEFEVMRQQKMAIAQIQKQAWRDSIMNRILQAMRETLVLHEVLQTTVDLLHDSLQASRCIIFRPDDTDRMKTCVVSKINPLDVTDQALLGIYCEFYDIFETELLQGSQITIHQADLHSSQEVKDFAERYGIRSLLITPLLYQQTYLGGISIYHLEQERFWTEDEQSLISEIAYQCAIAIHQANLYHNAQMELMERKRIESQLRHDAFHDALTGLPNRSLFIDRLSHAMQLFQRRVSSHTDGSLNSFAVMFLDLDRFKLINDSLGHLAGDQLLKIVADRLTSCVRSGDTVARLGGDEFVMLLENVTKVEDVIDVVQRIQNSLKMPIFLSKDSGDDLPQGHEIFVSTSIGIAIHDSHYHKPDELLRDADTAMYQAKELGRDRYEIFNTVMHDDALNRLRLESDLRRALDRQEFSLQYQPIVCLKSRHILGFEVLIRWMHPERGLLYPGEFIPLAEDTGLIVRIDFWVLQEACTQMKLWLDQFPHARSLSININLSGRQFNQRGLTQKIQEILEEVGVSSLHLKIEVTESILIEKTSIATEILAELRTQNIQTCIDDFGTGYSSLSYLRRFPIHTLKIDRSFISQVGTSEESNEIVKAIIVLGINLGLNVIAEGVESEEQLSFLHTNNCHAGQGFYFYPSLDAADITNMLRDLPTDGDHTDPMILRCPDL